MLSINVGLQPGLSWVARDIAGIKLLPYKICYHIKFALILKGYNVSQLRGHKVGKRGHC